MISNLDYEIPIVYDENLLKLKYPMYINWNPAVAPHGIIIGATGSGKTYFCTLLLGKIALHSGENTKIIVCDFKGDDDFSFLNGTEHYYKFTECTEGLEEFYAILLDRQNGNEDRSMRVLFFDEWASFLGVLDKKQSEEAKKKLSNLLMLGRSFNLHIIISQQRSDAKFFDSARDNFCLIIGLGNLSTESKDMLFREYKAEMDIDCKRGVGYILTNGAELTKIRVPHITDFEKLHSVIRKAVE